MINGRGRFEVRKKKEEELMKRITEESEKMPFSTMKTSEFEVDQNMKVVDLRVRVAWPQTVSQSEVRAKSYGHFPISAQSRVLQSILQYNRLYFPGQRQSIVPYNRLS